MTEGVDPRKTDTELAAQIERRHRQPNLCTIYLPRPDGGSRQCMWITAKEGSFVDLDSKR